MPTEYIVTIEDIREQAWDSFKEYVRLMEASLGRALFNAFDEELLYFFPPPPAQPKPEESPPPQRFTGKCSKCGMYFQYQLGDPARHKGCKKA